MERTSSRGERDVFRRLKVAIQGSKVKPITSWPYADTFLGSLRCFGQAKFQSALSAVLMVITLSFIRASVTIGEEYHRDENTKEGNHAPQMEPLRFARLAAEEQLRQASGFFQAMSARRTVRSFSPSPCRSS